MHPLTSINAGIAEFYEIGRASIHLLTALIAEGSLGILDCGSETLIEGKWVDGSRCPGK
ncbi:hypothetical protein [Rubellicoccus peritrichatus]|uniref:Uncharacterized protein n=1 Tax=Rubellicoccus peritrichatus TaxID=3080537 RepID=A0AAQ3L7R7_9BACT|nr:hypothetical protein [Puniceicoccus sp. CR14]WOO39429.1 hypothetical protein RZN69_12460 [Puniceicoccus sp. CR14]